MPIHAPSRLHHSLTASVDCRPIMPMRTTIVSTKEAATSGGAQMKACQAPAPSGVFHECSRTMTAHNRACITTTATTGGSADSTTALIPVRRIANRDSSHIEEKTTASGKGQKRAAVVNAVPYESSVDSS